MTEYTPPLVHLPGTTLTPEVVLHRTLNKLPRIKAVTVIIQWDDDSFDCDWSSMKTSELVMGAACLRVESDRVAMGWRAGEEPSR